MEILRLKHVSKIYGTKVQYTALNDISLSIEKGEFVGIMDLPGAERPLSLM